MAERAERKENLSEQAYEILKDKILSFELAPGTVVSDYLLSREMEMSRTPIREALVRLAQNGLITSGPDKKTTVSQANLTDITEIYQARMAVEGKAVELIMDHGGLTEEQKAALHAVQEQLKESLQNADMRANYEDDEQFHSLIVAFAGNSRLVEFLDRLRLQSMRARYLTVTTPQWHSQTLREHGEILDALCRGDREASLQAVNRHLNDAIENYRAILSKFPSASAMHSVSFMQGR